MRHTTCMALALILLAAPGSARAARPSLRLGTVKDEGGSIVTGEVQDPLTFPLPEPVHNWGQERRVKGYAYSLKIHEVLFGTVPEAVIHLPFSPAGYATNWEWNRAPEAGMKLLVYLKPKTGDPYEAYAYGNGVETLADFEDSAVVGLRKIIAVWRLPTAEEQLTAVREGCYSNNLRFQRWCLATMAGFGFRDGLDLSAVQSDAAGRALVKQVFFTKDMSFDAIQYCDYLLQHDREFRASKERYDVFFGLLDRYATGDANTDSNRVGGIVGDLLAYPAQALKTFERLATIAENPESPGAYVVTIRLGSLWQPGQDELNGRIERCLEALLKGPNAKAAAHALEVIEKKRAESAPAP